MTATATPRARRATLALSAACLALLASIFGLPPDLITDISRSPLGPILGVGVWLVPALLGLLALYRVSGREWGVESVALAGLGLLTLLTLLLNLRTVVTSPGTFTYGGRGTFVGPFVTLAAGSAVAFVVLAGETVARLER